MHDLGKRVGCRLMAVETDVMTGSCAGNATTFHKASAKHRRDFFHRAITLVLCPHL